MYKVDDDNYCIGLLVRHIVPILVAIEINDNISNDG